MDFFEVKMTEQDDPFIDLKNRITFWILKKHCFIYYVRRFLIIAHVISLSLFFFRSDGLASMINIFLQTPITITYCLPMLLTTEHFDEVYRHVYSIKNCKNKLKDIIAKENKNAVFIANISLIFWSVGAISALSGFFLIDDNVIPFNKFGIFGKKLEYLGDFIMICYVLGISCNLSILMNLWSYLVSQYKIQVFMIIGRLEELKDFKNGDIDKFNNYYQEVVRVTLRKSIIQHLQIKKLFRSLDILINTIAIFLTLAGFFILISFLWILIIEGSAAISMPLTGLIVTMTTLFQACLHGETLKLSSMKLYETLCETDWIHWNESNSKTLFIMIQVSATPMKISFLSISNVDFDLLKNFYKWSYPMVSLIIRGKWNKDESLENINI
ncbi:uncharacterized protein LOC130447958 [Diorhabda sublineata]|uniref:uncharacterized protein LOC130447958 n=1 Tax=Diorhabda sublineata TaxID=1163346 RepID=UPI0024E0BC27|nr:uncharacterized protein LOC130447958 [Diorhabda sublineata]